MNTIQIFTIVGYVLPLVNSIIQIVENFPNLTGEQKKQAALSLIKSVYVGLQDPAIAKIKEIQGVPFETLAPFLGSLIDTLVTVFNATGVFKKA